MLPQHQKRSFEEQGFRWSFDIVYNKTGEATGRSYFPAFVARSRADPASQLRDWRMRALLWQKARARLVVQPHIDDIHRWQSDVPYCA
tara:strand:- start:115241 stop:115504 length:264 start_codon:yes stop_codon:yes gene_type:complete